MIRSRLLTDNEQVFEHNAWDDVEWDQERINQAESIIDTQKQIQMDTDDITNYDNNADQFWDKFYQKHENKFFKDRKWFQSEYPELFTRPNDTDEEFSVFEVGCGVGNSVFPIISAHKDDDKPFRMYACDFSQTAVDIVKQHDLYAQNNCTAFVHDLGSPEMPTEIPENSIDVILSVFVLSAMSPDKITLVFSKFYKWLKPGGLILFRDYGRYDLAQLRFKPGRLIRENFYVRGDGTQVYFFTQEELSGLAAGAGFEVIQNTVDRRLLVNRMKKITMYRAWIQCKLRKPIS